MHALKHVLSRVHLKHEEGYEYPSGSSSLVFAYNFQARERSWPVVGEFCLTKNAMKRTLFPSLAFLFTLFAILTAMFSLPLDY